MINKKAGKESNEAIIIRCVRNDKDIKRFNMANFFIQSSWVYMGKIFQQKREKQYFLSPSLCASCHSCICQAVRVFFFNTSPTRNAMPRVIRPPIVPEMLVPSLLPSFFLASPSDFVATLAVSATFGFLKE